MKASVTKITIERLEGHTDLCGIVKTFTSFKDANLWIMSQEDTFAKVGYDKHALKVEFENADTFEGRLDLQNPDNERYDYKGQRVEEHIKAVLNTEALNALHLSINRNDYED